MEFLCIDILNSDRVDWQHEKQRRDMLEDDQWMGALAQKWALPVSGVVERTALHQLKALRAQMYGVVAEMGEGRPIQPEQLVPINALLKGTTSYSQLSFAGGSFHLAQNYATDGWALVVWQVAKSFADMVCQYDNTRIKICDNDDCGWVFFDGSKNKSRRWCDNGACGNIMKVRAYRARKKAEP